MPYLAHDNLVMMIFVMMASSMKQLELIFQYFWENLQRYGMH